MVTDQNTLENCYRPRDTLFSPCGHIVKTITPRICGPRHETLFLSVLVTTLIKDELKSAQLGEYVLLVVWPSVLPAV